jgi:hypothetical protein
MAERMYSTSASISVDKKKVKEKNKFVTPRSEKMSFDSLLNQS